ncbi:hypothetical protein GCM10027610_009520 [Dactylosporangium cerinum]
MRVAGDVGIRAEMRVEAGVGHDELPPVADGVDAEGDVERGLGVAEAGVAREPLPVPVDEGDRRHRGVEDGAREPGELVEGRRAGAVEDAVTVQRGEAGVLVVSMCRHLVSPARLCPIRFGLPRCLPRSRTVAVR